jgi:hypothetical protein
MRLKAFKRLKESKILWHVARSMIGEEEEEEVVVVVVVVTAAANSWKRE